MMLVHLGEEAAADKLQTAIEDVYRTGKCLTGDVGGTRVHGRLHRRRGESD